MGWMMEEGAERECRESEVEKGLVRNSGNCRELREIAVGR